MKIKSLLSMAFAMLCMTSAMAQSKTVTTTSAGSLASQLTDDEKAAVKELTVSGPLNKTDFNFIMTMTALESLDIKAATIAEETLDGKTYPADELPQQALNQNQTIKNLVLPASIVSIGENCFESALVENVDFSVCTKLKTIGKQSFYMASHISSINLSGLKNLELIDYQAFGSCASKTEATTLDINLSGCSSLKKLGEYAFSNIKRTSPALSLNLNFEGCTSLASIENRAFLNGKMTNVDLSECTALETISTSVFQNTAGTIATLTLPVNLKTIAAKAFNGQKKFTSVTSLAVVPPTLAADGFTASGIENVTLTVPVGAKTAYEANEEWKKFKEIVESDGSSVKEFEAAEAKIWGANNTIYVVNAEEGANVNVYDLSGALVASGKVSNGSATLQVSAKGLYLVKAASATAKIRL